MQLKKIERDDLQEKANPESFFVIVTTTIFEVTKVFEEALDSSLMMWWNIQ